MTLYNRLTGNRIDLIVCDGDGTLINYTGSPTKSSWDFVGHMYCEREEWQKITDRYLASIKGTQDKDEQERLFCEWARADIAALKGQDVHKALTAPIPYSRGVREYFAQQNGAYRAIISAGLDVIFDRAAKELGFNKCYTNHPSIDSGKFDGTLRYEVTLHNKLDILITLLMMMETASTGTTLAIGDGFNDIEMLATVKKAGGLALAMDTEEREVIAASNAVITDFREIDKYTFRR